MSAIDLYMQQHQEQLETCMSEALNALLDAQPTSPTRFLADFFARQEAAEPAQVKAAVHRAEGVRRLSGASEPQVKGSAWTAQSWLDSLGLTEEIGKALCAPLGAGADDAVLQLEYVRALAGACEDDASGRAAVHALLNRGPLLDELADRIWRSVRALSTARAASAAELHDKFCSEGSAFTMAFSGLSTFYGGLEARTPAPRSSQTPQPRIPRKPPPPPQPRATRATRARRLARAPLLRSPAAGPHRRAFAQPQRRDAHRALRRGRLQGRVPDGKLRHAHHQRGRVGLRHRR